MRKLAILYSVVSIASIQAQVPTPMGGTPAATAPAVGSPAMIEPPTATPSPADVPAPTPALAAPAPVEAVPQTVNPNARSVHEFQGDEVSVVLRLLARQAGINIMVSDQITGTVNMRVENLTPLEAIKVIVDAKGLDLAQTNSVYFVKTSGEKAKEPTESSSYTFSYAKAADTLPLVTAQILSGVAPQIDVRTNTVFFRDFKSNMANLALFFESIDRPTRQVMIEARLVEVNANPKQSYGINWAGTFGGATSAQTFKFGGTGLATAKLVDSKVLDAQGVPFQATRTDSLATVNTTDVSNFVLNGKNPGFLSAVAGQAAILNVPQMSATLRLLNEDSDTEFLANPRIVTANSLKADIKITRKQPVPKMNFNEQTATAVFSGFEDKEYGNTLSVTPTINKDNYVTMLVKPEISNKVGDQSFMPPGGTQPLLSPIIDTRSLESNVLIRSGDTLAIGGLLQDEVGKSRTKVPILGDIPVLGYLFQERVNARSKRNLLIFITPTIIKQGYGTGLEDQVSGLKNSGEEFADPNGWRNNARGAIRLVPTSNRQVVADYPKPGIAPAPNSPTKKSNFPYKVTVPEREQ